jgi:3-oxoacyl-[acyl-carrier protein] reductase
MAERVMIITGTRKGIGRSLSEYYLTKGYVVAGCSRLPSDLEHENYEHFCVDVGQEDSVNGMVSCLWRKYRRIDALINNAGIASMNHTLLTPLSTVQDIFNTNVFGTFLFSREVAKVMGRRRTGRIVNFSTVGVAMRLEGEAIYTASKAAVEMLTKILAKELAHMNVTVNAVAPTPAETDLIRNVPKDKIAALVERQAVKRLSSDADIANVVDFYLDERSDMISGQTIYLGGVA